MSTDGLTFLALAAAVEESGGGFLFLQIIGVISGILGLVFFWFSSGYGSLSGFLHTDACCWQR